MFFSLSRGKVDLQKYSGILLLDKILSGKGIFKPSYLNNTSKRSDCTPASLVLKSTCLMQSFGMTNFQDVREMNMDTIFSSTLGRTIAPETLRQRLNVLAKNNSIFKDIDNTVVDLLKGANFRTVSFSGKRYIPLDIDVTPLCNPHVQKEGIEYTYKGVDGYAPIMAYLGQYALCFELRPGSQHSENGAVEFLLRCLALIKKLGLNSKDILVRVDSGHDDAEFMKACEKNHVFYLVKRNHRRESQVYYAKKAIDMVGPSCVSEHEKYRIYYFVEPHKKPSEASDCAAYCLYKVIEPYKEESGILSYPLMRDLDPKSPRFTFGSDVPCEVQSIWTNLPRSAKDDVHYGKAFAQIGFRMYNDHATSEQFHSELKTDMNMELLPSKYFATNKLFLALSALSFNALRLIGDKAVSIDDSLQHHKARRVQRIRLRTVIDKFCTIACRVIRHARNISVVFGKKCPYYDTFVKLYR